MAQTDQQIIRQVLQGESQLYAVLVSRYQKKLFNFMLRVCLIEQDAEDLTQDAFVKAYEKLDKFKAERSFLNWLYAIALNLYRDSARKWQARAGKQEMYQYHLSNECQVESLEDAVAGRDQMQRLLGALGQLPQEYREVISLRYGNDLSMKEISETLRVSVSGAKMRVSRGLSKLKAVFCAECGGE